MDDKRQLLRHTVATLAYRAARALEGAPDNFATFDGCRRQPGQILAHMGDLFDWALSAVQGSERWHNSTPLRGPQKSSASSPPSKPSTITSHQTSRSMPPQSRSFRDQSPTRSPTSARSRCSAASLAVPARSENFFVATIAAGQVSAEQPAAVQPLR